MKTHVPFRFHLFSEVSVPFSIGVDCVDFYHPSEIGPSLDDIGETPILQWLARRPDLVLSEWPNFGSVGQRIPSWT